MSVIGTFPYTISNGQNMDAGPVMSDFNYIQSQVNTNVPTLISASVTQVSGIAGAASNVAMSVSAASATATISADEIIVETALGGIAYKISSYSQSVNLATVGAGGMDVGTAPVSGFVALYAIYNTAGTASILAVNATSTVASGVYSGSHMPSGYTASALISVLPTNSSSQFPPLNQTGRDIEIPSVLSLATSAQTSGVTQVAITTSVPMNAKSIGGFVIQSSTSGGQIDCILSATSSAATPGEQYFVYAGTSSAGWVSNFSKLGLATPQLLWFQATVASGSMSLAIYISKYSI